LLLPYTGIIPGPLTPGITVNLAEMRLYHLWRENGRLRARIYPVGIGISGRETPEGVFTISITNGSSGTINNYIWDLGDGTTGSGPTPPSAHTYAGAGPWTVTITAENTALGLSDVWTNTFTLIAPPVANFTVAQVGSPPNTIAVTNVSTGNITGYSWTFGDGVGTSTQQNPPNYTYAAGATYTMPLVRSGRDPVKPIKRYSLQDRSALY
jgi:hypothetical protein